MKSLFQRRERRVPDLKTGNLRLVAITPAMMQAEQERDLDFRELRRLLNAQLTEEWPPEHWEPHVHDFILAQFEEYPETLGWHRYVLLDAPTGTNLIGAVGGFPKPNGDVEIGYSTLPAFQRMGYGSASARALVRWLLKRKGVKSVSAQTLLRLPESVKVMVRCGMSPAGEGDEPETVRYRITK